MLAPNLHGDGFFRQQSASFHGDRCAGRSDPGMLDAELGEPEVIDHRFGEDFTT
jgi:hypothetical protein